MNKSDFNKNYNVTKILTDKVEIMKQLETFNEKNQAVAFGIKKQPNDPTPTWFKQYAIKQDKFNKTMLTRLDNLENLLLNVIKLNNLKTK